MGADPLVAALTHGATRPAMRDELGGLARSGSVTLLGAGVTAVLGAAFAVLVTNTFSPEQAGVFFVATSVFLLAYTVARLGTGTGVVYFTSRYRVLGTPERVRAALLVAAVPVAVLSVAVGVALFLLAPGLSDRIVRGGGDAAVQPLRALAVFVPFAAVLDIGLAAARGFGRMGPLVLVEKVARPAAQMAGLLIVVAAGWSASLALPLAWAVPYAPAAVAALVWLVALRRGMERRAEVRPVRADRAEVLTFWRFTAPRALASVAQIGLQRLDVVLIGVLLGPVQAAVYAASTRFLVFGQLGSQALSIAVQHRLSERLAVDDRAGAAELYRTSTAWLVVLTWPVYLLFAVFAPFVLRVFGEGYDAGEPVMLVLAAAMLLATACGMVDSVLNMAGRTSWTLYNAVLALTVDVALTLVLVPRMGILGAAVAWGVAIAVNNLVPLTQLSVSLGLHPFGRGTVLAAGLAASCFGAVPALAALVAGRTLGVLLVATAVGTVLYLVGLWAARVPLRLSALRALRRRGPSVGGPTAQRAGR